MERWLWSGSQTEPKCGKSGLLELCHEAYDQYQIEVVKSNKLYQRFADDLVYSHEFHDALDARSKNEHQKNFNIIKTLLWERRDLVELFFSQPSLSDDSINEFINLFNTTTSIPNKNANHVPSAGERSFDCCLTKDEYVILAECCNTMEIFTTKVSVDQVISLLDGSLTKPLRSKNNRYLAYLFEQLSIRSLIVRNWQIVIGSKKQIYSSSGNTFLTQKAVASALHQVSAGGMNATCKMIYDFADQIKESNDRKRR